MNFAYPYLLFIPLLFLLRFFYAHSKQTAVNYGDITALKISKAGLRLALRKPVLALLAFSVIINLSIAASRPQLIEYIDIPEESRNIMLAIDLSGSMRARDFQSNFRYISRLEAVKTVIAEFVNSRQQDRIGLVVFGSQAFLQSPLTRDHSLVLEMVNNLQVGMAGDNTAIGDGLGLSLKRIREIEGKSKAIILLTDGVNNAGDVNPLKAAKIASDLQIKIHTIGIGSSSEQPYNRFGLNFSQPYTADFDEDSLRKIAELTGGVYFNASSIEGLRAVYREIDKLEKSQGQQGSVQLINEFFPHFVLLALLSYLLSVLLSRSYFMKVPAS